MRSAQLLLLGWLAGLATVGLGAVAVIECGLFDATAITPHYPPIAWATHEAMIRSVQVRASRAPAPPPDPQAIRRGFRLYETRCEMCHGGPGVARQGWVDGMTPAPPYLLDAARRWSPGELTHLVSKGVKMTGMPAWGPRMSPAELTDTVAFLEALPDLSPAAYARLRASAQSQPQAPAAPAG